MTSLQAWIDAARPAGVLHPALVHAPIGLLVALVLVELFARDATRVRRVLAWALALSALVAAGAGWLHADGTGVDDATIFWHRWTGVGFAGVALVVALLSFASTPGTAWRRGYGLALVASAAAAGVAGHQGGELVHGPLVFDGWTTDDDETSVADAPQHAASTWLASCVRCHGPDRREADLRLDTSEGLARVVVPGAAVDSEVYRRVALPRDHDDAMPPTGTPLPPETVAALAAWIDAGAAGLTVASDDAPSWTPELLAEVAATSGALVVPLADAPDDPDASRLRVEFHTRPDAFDPTSLAALAPVAAHVATLNLRTTALDDATLLAAPHFPQLERLHVERTAIGDASVDWIARHDALRHLNLHGTSVTDAGARRLARLTSLERLVLHDTDVGLAEVSRLRAALPRARITVGEASWPTKPTDDG